MREIFHLIKHGFNSFHLEKMSVSRRRFYFNMYVTDLREMREAQEKAAGRSQVPEKIKFDPNRK